MQVRFDLRRREKRSDPAQGTRHGSAASPPDADGDCRPRLGGCPIDLGGSAQALAYAVGLVQKRLLNPTAQQHSHASIVPYPSGGFKPGNFGRGPNENLAYENRGAVVSFLARSELSIHSEKLQPRFNPGHHPARNVGLPISILNQIRLNLVSPNGSRMSK